MLLNGSRVGYELYRRLLGSLADYPEHGWLGVCRRGGMTGADSCTAGSLCNERKLEEQDGLWE